jgi:hypothetical protein
MEERGATFSEDRKKRYRLWRSWDTTKQSVLFIMMNPSTANKDADDPTINIIKQHAANWEFGGLYVGNLYAHCCSNSSEARRIINPDERDATNEQHIREMAAQCSKVVYAWGTKGPNKKTQREPKWLREIVSDVAYCIDMTAKDKLPKHPKQWSHNTLKIMERPCVYRTAKI